MKKLIILLTGILFSLHVKAQGPLFILNNIDCPVNFTLTAHTSGGPCDEYYSDVVTMTAPAMATTSFMGFHSLTNWWYGAGGFYVPGASIPNPPSWDAFRFSITSDPTCISSSILLNCDTTILNYTSTCAPCPAAPSSPVYVSWVSIPPNQTYIFINY